MLPVIITSAIFLEIYLPVNCIYKLMGRYKFRIEVYGDKKRKVRQKE